jgi:hypothetical protein
MGKVKKFSETKTGKYVKEKTDVSEIDSESKDLCRSIRVNEYKKGYELRTN